MRRLALVATAAALLAGCGAPLGAQAADSAVRDVAARFFGAADRQRWDSAALLVDSLDAEQFRDRELALLIGVAEHFTALRRMMSGHGSGGISLGPDSAVTAKDIEKYGAWRLRWLSGTPTIGELAALPARDLLERAYEAAFRLCDDAGRCGPHPRYEAGWRVIGVVVENDSLAHALYRHGADPERPVPGSSGAVSVAEVVRRSGRWGMTLGERGPLTSMIDLMDEKLGLAPPSSPARRRP